MFQKKRLCAAIAMASMGHMPAQAVIEEIVVTATKRPESTQDIGVAVSAVNETALNDLGISNFEDYLVQLPGVTAGGSGPGQNTIYIRGVASTTPNLTTAGVAGLAPNVALYLDEQPLSQPGRNLDVYAADLSRVEVLKGPQGTLFGASSQAGTVRLITNKPDRSGTYASVKFGTSATHDGEMNNKVVGMINVPLSDSMVVRGVVYVDRQGGYIDNVAGTRDASESGRFRPEGTVRINGVRVNGDRAGSQSDSNLSAVNFIEADNSARTEENFNTTTYSGARISALWDINEDWSLTVAHTSQDIESDGVFFADPDLGDLEIQRFDDDSIDDGFHNTNWTLEGRLASLEVVYTGAFTERETDQVVDYADYLFVGEYLPYYICDGLVSYPGSADPAGTCQAPYLFVASHTETEVATHELRFATDQTRGVRATFGAFYSDLTLQERNDFTYPGSTQVVGWGQIGFSPNYPFPTGYISEAGPFPAGVIFRNDVERTDAQTGFFGEVSVDLSEQFSVTLGARWYDIEVDMDGSANSSFCNLGGPDANAYGTDISDLYNGDGRVTFRGTCTVANQITYTADSVDASTPAAVVGALKAPDSAQTDGVIGKATLTWAPNADYLFYATISEGFRPGLLNRPGGASNTAGTFTVPFALETDEVTNYEFGWKTDLLDYTLRFNASIFRVDIEKFQTTIFDPSIVNLFFSDNAADAEVTGFEGDFIWDPASVDGLTINGAFSFLDTEITRVLTPTNDVRQGDELAYAPQFQANLRARYEWALSGGMTAHVMPHIAYSADSYSDIITINRDQVDGWVMLGLTAGVRADEWSAEFFVDNLTDKRAELSRSFVYDRERVTYARPRTMGVRVSYDF